MSTKRFYETVEVVEQPDGYHILLDGRTLKTPGKQVLQTKTHYIAELIAKEWRAQDTEIKPETMPVTRLINVAIEQTPSNRERLIKEARKYAETDLLCYRASEPQDLVERQSEQWDPLLSWAKKQGIELDVTQSISAIKQSGASLDNVAQFARDLGDVDLTLLVHFIAVFGSAVLGIAVLSQHITALEAFDISRLDNIYQIEKWGEDEEATHATKTLSLEVDALSQIIRSS